jgi:hypothetical protein
MGPFRELLAIDQRQALEFLSQRLKDVSGPAVDPPELLYNASLLAHYAQVSTAAETEPATPATLSAAFDRFVADSAPRRDGVVRGSDAPPAQHPMVCAAVKAAAPRPTAPTTRLGFSVEA